MQHWKLRQQLWPPRLWPRIVGKYGMVLLYGMEHFNTINALAQETSAYVIICIVLLLCTINDVSDFICNGFCKTHLFLNTRPVPHSARQAHRPARPTTASGGAFGATGQRTGMQRLIKSIDVIDGQ